MAKDELIAKAEKLLIEGSTMDPAAFTRSKEQRIYDFYIERIEHLELLEQIVAARKGENEISHLTSTHEESV